MSRQEFIRAAAAKAKRSSSPSSSTPSSPKLRSRDSFPLPTGNSARQSFSVVSNTVALGYVNNGTSNASGSADSFESIDSHASLQAILEGVRGGRFQDVARFRQTVHSPNSTLESLCPFLSESTIVEPEERRPRFALFDNLINLVIRLLRVRDGRIPDDAVVTQPQQEGPAPQPQQQTQPIIFQNGAQYVSFDDLLASYPPNTPINPFRLDAPSNVARDNASEGEHADDVHTSARIGQEESAPVAGTSAAAQQPDRLAVPCVVVEDVDRAQEMLRRFGRGARAIGNHRCERTPSLQMADDTHLSSPRTYRNRAVRPPVDCPCVGNNCFCYVTGIYPRRAPVNRREQAAFLNAWAAPMRVKPRFEQGSLYNVHPSASRNLNTFDAAQAGPSRQPARRYSEEENARILGRFIRDFGTTDDEDEDEDFIDIVATSSKASGKKAK